MLKSSFFFFNQLGEECIPGIVTKNRHFWFFPASEKLGKVICDSCKFKSKKQLVIFALMIFTINNSKEIFMVNVKIYFIYSQYFDFVRQSCLQI